MTSSPEGHRLRLAVLGVVIMSLFATLTARLWYLQFLASPKLATAAAENANRTILEPAPRGRMIDAKGQVLADNRLSLAVVVDPRKMKDEEATINRLATVLSTAGQKITATDIQRRIDDPRALPDTGHAIATDVPKAIAIEL